MLRLTLFATDTAVEQIITAFHNKTLVDIPQKRNSPQKRLARLLCGVIDAEMTDDGPGPEGILYKKLVEPKHLGTLATNVKVERQIEEGGMLREVDIARLKEHMSRCSYFYPQVDCMHSFLSYSICRHGFSFSYPYSTPSRLGSADYMRIRDVCQLQITSLQAQIDLTDRQLKAIAAKGRGGQAQKAPNRRPVNSFLCLARSSTDGGQCTHTPEAGSDFCKHHGSRDLLKTYKSGPAGSCKSCTKRAGVRVKHTFRWEHAGRYFPSKRRRVLVPDDLEARATRSTQE
jgi:hypothetical protein